VEKRAVWPVRCIARAILRVENSPVLDFGALVSCSCRSMSGPPDSER
ncbi:uncharacterized protein METZ01_LOCUS507179, partial [marine metagenome]